MRYDIATIVINEAMAISRAIAISGAIIMSRGYSYK